MKIILINPPSPYLANDAAYPPTGLMYLAASIEDMEHSVEIIDFSGNSNWASEVKNLEADLFGITCVTPNFFVVKEIANNLPKNSIIIIGGPHPTFLPEDVLTNIRCNSVVRGEGEIAIKNIINDLDKNNLKEIYCGGLVGVDQIPVPSRHLVDLYKYMPGRVHTVPIYTSRGCTFDCAFCSKVTGRVYRALSVDRILQEVHQILKQGFKNILFGDDNIHIDNNRLEFLLKKLKPLNISFRLNQDTRNINEKTIELAAESGCTEISFGVESGSEKMLKLMNKKATVQDNVNAIKLTKKYGMVAKAYFVVNFPGENESTIEETLEFVKNTKPDKYLISAFAPLPGSPVFYNPKKYGIYWASKNWADYYLVGKDGGFSPCFKTLELSFEKQIYLHNKLFKGLKEINCVGEGK